MCCDRHLRSLGCRTTPLEHWSKRKPTVEPLWAKQQTKKFRPKPTKINSFMSGPSLSLTPDPPTEKVRKIIKSVIPKPHAQLHSMPKTSAKFKNNGRKPVRGVAPTKKQQRKGGDILFPIISQWVLSIAMETRVLIQTVPKTYAAFPPP